MNGPQSILFGNVTRDPELKYTANNGTPWVTLGVATNRTISPEETETLFWDVTLWRHTAEYAARNVRRGMGIYASGAFSLRTYTRSDGELVIVPCLNAFDFEVTTRGAPAAESWLEHRPARDGATTDTPPSQTTRQQRPARADTQQRQQRTGGADIEQRQPRRQPENQPRQDQQTRQPTREPAREPALDRQQAPTRAPAPQPQRSDDEPQFEPPEEPNYSPAFYDED